MTPRKRRRRNEHGAYDVTIAGAREAIECPSPPLPPPPPRSAACMHTSITNETPAAERNVITIAAVEDAGLALAGGGGELPNCEGRHKKVFQMMVVWREASSRTRFLQAGVGRLNPSVSIAASAGGDDPGKITV